MICKSTEKYEFVETREHDLIYTLQRDSRVALKESWAKGGVG